jgi:hypothetical protein
MSVNNALTKLTGSAPRSSEGIYKAATPLFSPNKASATRLLSVPAESAAKVSNFASDTIGVSTIGASSIINTNSPAKSSGGSFWRYLFVFLILSFLSLTLVLFLIKPADKDISHLYDPLKKYFNIHISVDNKRTSGAVAAAEKDKKPEKPGLEKLEKALAVKPALNNIDNKQTQPVIQAAKTNNNLVSPQKKYKKLPVIPEADDSTSAIQMNPTSKAGFCYIGEDRGFRSCIDVGVGDVCMSGDIFPTEAICINPNLRE